RRELVWNGEVVSRTYVEFAKMVETYLRYVRVFEQNRKFQLNWAFLADEVLQFDLEWKNVELSAMVQEKVDREKRTDEDKKRHAEQPDEEVDYYPNAGALHSADSFTKKGHHPKRAMMHQQGTTNKVLVFEYVKGDKRRLNWRPKRVRHAMNELAF
ncbi:unnamed protein product, partial [Amoebophrya sp. A120]